MNDILDGNSTHRIPSYVHRHPSGGDQSDTQVIKI
jgi:hypothetical protein